MKFGLIGKKLGHSWSKEIHGKLYDYDYDMIELDEDEFSSFMLDNNYDGFNITIPYKKKAASLCSYLSLSARLTGSVNTVIYDKDGSLMGYNTDLFGFGYLCSFSDIHIKGKKIMILGDGGTSDTVNAAVTDMMAFDVKVISRNGLNTYEDLSRFKATQVVINTTPVGTYPDNYNKIIDIDMLPECEAVIDVIYNPMRTPIIEDAIEKGIKNANGFPMLIAQAKYAGQLFLREKDALDERFFDDRDEKIAEVFKDITSSLANIVLIGMPGSGKTVIGEAIARITGREHIDIDDEIEKTEGMSVPDIFSTHGEAYFRKKEFEMMRDICKMNNLIITPGGGSVLDYDNIRAMKQNGIIIWIKRDLTELDMGNRPLSKDMGALKKIYAERKEIYNSSCDIKIDNDGSTDDVVFSLMDQLKSYTDKNGGFK